jgi:hypothetical protein
VIEVIDSLQVHQSEEVPTRKIAAFSYFYDRAVDAGMIEQGASAVVQVRYSSLLLSSTLGVTCGLLHFVKIGFCSSGLKEYFPYRK